MANEISVTNVILGRVDSLGAVRGAEKRNVKVMGKEEAQKIVKEKKDKDEELLGVYSDFLRIKEFLSAFEKELKPELVEAAKRLDLTKRSKLGNTEYHLISKTTIDYSTCGSEILKSLLADKAEAEENISNLQNKLKNIEGSQEINGEELNAPTTKETNVLNAYF